MASSSGRSLVLFGQRPRLFGPGAGVSRSHIDNVRFGEPINPFVEAEHAAQAHQEAMRGGRISTPRMRSDAQSFQNAMRRQVVTDTHDDTSETHADTLELQETMLTNMITQAKQMQDMMNNLHQQLAIYEELFGQPRTPVHETEGSIADKGTQTDNYPSTKRIRRDM